MLNVVQQRNLRRVLNSPFTLGFVLLLAGLVSWSVIERAFIAGDVKDRREQVEAEVAALRQRQITLEGDVEYLQSERGQEAEMRRQFDVALPGEQVVVIVDEATDTNAETVPSAIATTTEARWYEFWR